LPANRTTGLSPEQFAELCRRVADEIGPWNTRTGRPRALTMGKAVKATVMYFKNNITQEVVAEALEVSQPTVSRAIAEIEPVIAAVLDDCVPEVPEALTGRVAVLDGTLAPCWSWAQAPELRSGKHRTTGHNHQVLVTLDGRLIHVGDPLPGCTHDTRAARDTHLLDVLDAPNTIADKGYLGTGILTPFRKPRGAELLQWQKDFNTQINSLRAVVERAISHLKTWRALHTDYRRPRHSYPTAFKAIRALHFFKLSYE
jgi:DDE superfamily endonuclease